MYLRLGWVVGNAGFLGALVIILLAKSITICTALSMSSITTNIKIGAGGAFSIISKSLGLEAGGSVGIPFYIAQTLSTALYILGFTEGWIRIFPAHPPIIISFIVWIILLTISYISTQFAIRIQYIILGVIALSLISFFFSSAQPNENLILIGQFQDADFWLVFAIFFPAVTGIMAGANMSGDLEDPRKSIPQGTLMAIGLTLIIYVAIAYMAAYLIPQIELRQNQMVMVDYARKIFHDLFDFIIFYPLFIHETTYPSHFSHLILYYRSVFLTIVYQVHDHLSRVPMPMPVQFHQI